MRAIGLDIHRDFCEVAIAEGGRVRGAGRTDRDVMEECRIRIAGQDADEGRRA